MKLYYFHDADGNFGDDLNPWLWPRLIPELCQRCDDPDWLVGIGTLLNHRLPGTGALHVMGSGVGYGDRMRQDADVHFHAVRGHKSAAALGLRADAVITDAAVLLRTMQVPASRLSRERVGVMFTGRSLRNYDWATVCASLGHAFISCHWPVDRVFDELQRCDLLLTEAMHGAIVADALRVPWVPITCSEGVLGFKWEDWLSTVGLPYEPTTVTPLYDLGRHLDWPGRLKQQGRRVLVRLGVAARDGLLPTRSSPSQVDLSRRQLQQAAGRRGLLSQESLLDAHVQRFQVRIDALRATLQQRA
jgi:succinoglycan biosynthesis protein ExoV